MNVSAAYYSFYSDYTVLIHMLKLYSKFGEILECLSSYRSIHIVHGSTLYDPFMLKGLFRGQSLIRAELHERGYEILHKLRMLLPHIT